VLSVLSISVVNNTMLKVGRESKEHLLGVPEELGDLDFVNSYLFVHMDSQHTHWGSW
jgi:hypothetical protein